MFSNLLIIKSNNYTNINPSEIIIRILNVSRSIRNTLIIILSNYLPLFISYIAIIIYFFIINIKLGLIFFVLFLINIYIINKNQNKL